MEQDKTMEEAETRRKLGRLILRQRNRIMRDKCLRALKRKHWQAIVEEIGYGEHGYKCFGEYPLKDPSLMCHSYLKAGEVGCEACVIVTKLMEVLDE